VSHGHGPTKAREPRLRASERIRAQASHHTHAPRIRVVSSVKRDPVAADRQIVVVDEKQNLAASPSNGLVSCFRRISAWRHHDPKARIAL
jgi:hypothetical protein